MALSFQNSGAGVGGAQVQTGPDIEDIRTEFLGFLALAGDSKVQLLSSSWPSDHPPPPTASLMSVASHKGLIAAAGPDAVLVATTESVRKAFDSTDGGKLKAFQPQLRLPMPMRISQLAFSADESYLVLSAEVGGGLAVYEVEALLQGSTQSSFELPTNGQALRALIPNPTAEKGELCAIVTSEGNLMMANLKERTFISGPDGQVLKDNVSCLSWSTKGKQLVAGLADGTAYQMTPDGIGKGDIPKPPSVDNNYHVSSITWLENNVFLLAHTPPSSDGNPPSSIFNVVTRTPPSSFTFQKSEEPAGPWGLNRSPPHHFILRLREFPPNLQDLIITTSTAATDIGLFSRSKVPLSKDKPADQITGVFTVTEMDNDSQRAQLPLSLDGSTGTSAIGLALDLSSKDKVVKPIPNDEMDESPTPLPAVMVLNNEGVLAAWWIVYSESIHQQTTYPGLISAGSTLEPQSTPGPTKTPAPTFGAPSTTTFIAQYTSTNAFGTRSAFGGASGAFGAPSGLGQRASVWGTPSTSTTAPSTSNTAAFGSPAFSPKPAVSASTPAFGSTSIPIFGSSGLPGVNRPSPWNSVGSTTQGSAFGQPASLGKPAPLFGSGTTSTGATAALTTGGFSSFATKGGFATVAPASSGSIFGPKTTSSPLSTPNTSSAMDTAGPFGGFTNKVDVKPTSLLGSNTFSLGSTFTADNSAKDNEPESLSGAKSSFFSGAFGSALDNAAKPSVAETPVSKETYMDSIEEPAKTNKPDSSTPASIPASVKSSLFTPAPPASLFGTPGPASSSPVTKPTTSARPNPGKAAGFGLENSNSTTTPASKPLTHSAQMPAINNTPQAPKIKEEPASPGAFLGKTSEPPLPPDPTSKVSYSAGDTSVSSTETDAPLPPDFIPRTAPEPAERPALSPLSSTSKASNSIPISADLIPPSDVPGGPEDEDDESGFGSERDDEGQDEGQDEEGEVDESEGVSEEGSGEDVTKDLSPTSDINQTPGFTPQSSFSGTNKGITDSNPFMKISKPVQTNTTRSLFGEIGSSAPVLPPPMVQASPRSPSPIRSALPGRMLRPDASRSVSAPGVASQILGRKPAATSRSTLNLSLQQHKADEQRREETRARKEQVEKQALVDDEDERMQEYLSSDLVPTRTLDEFIAHTDYAGSPSKDSIAAQVETVYRDINSMIDTLGINARALKCFIKGHTEQYKEEIRIREDLENGDDWCLVEIESLSTLEDQLSSDLEAGRIKDVADQLEACNDLQKDIIRLFAKNEEVNKLRLTHLESIQPLRARTQPLSAEQAAQQHDLRRNFARFQKLLSQAEEGLTVLKAKIVSQATSNGQNNSSASPTVEAVFRTITKMTSMAEKRSGDIDVLEGQMRKLRFGSIASPGSREGSPFATPQKSRASLRNPGTSSTYGLFYTPESIKDTSRFQPSLTSSTNSRTQTSPPRKKLSGYTIEEKAQIKRKFARKKDVTARLKEALKKSGTNVKLIEDD